MITAAYTICKNEIKYVEKWLYYTKDFNYRVILDTGSTDGTYEEFKKAGNVIVEQKIFTPWKFNVARNYNLDMIPEHVDWCLSPDLDEYFSINVLDEMENTIKKYPNVTNISCDRLDLYTKDVRVGPPKSIGTNKIHRRHDYHWVQPIYEHLFWKYTDRSEVEIYNDDIYLIHDQDFKKKERPELYLKMLREEFEENPKNCWTLWFLCSHYFREQDLDNFIKCGTVFIQYAGLPEKDKFKEIYGTLIHIHEKMNDQTTIEQKKILLEGLRKANQDLLRS
jgi:glycosyltransferase involved in cell wall biosynthesis